MTAGVTLNLPIGHELRGARAGVATKHHQTTTIARALGGPAGLKLQTTYVDTDTLGTFTGETPRTGAPRQTAITKAEWACQESGLDLGIGSEGSFFAHPDVGFITMHMEHVGLTQPSTGLTIIGSAIGAAPWVQTRTLTPEGNLNAVADKLGELLASGTQRLIAAPTPKRAPEALGAVTASAKASPPSSTSARPWTTPSATLRPDASSSRPTYAPTTAHRAATSSTPPHKTSPNGSQPDAPPATHQDSDTKSRAPARPARGAQDPLRPCSNTSTPAPPAATPKSKPFQEARAPTPEPAQNATPEQVEATQAPAKRRRHHRRTPNPHWNETSSRRGTM